MKQDDKYKLLIIKKLSGEIEPHEEEQLQQWLRQDQSNRLILAKYQKIWQQSDSIDPAVFDIDIESEWQKQKQLSNVRSSAKVINMRSIYPYIAAAAAVLILFFALFSAFSNKTYEYYASSNRDLTLPDGTNIVLKRGSKLIYTSKYNKKNRTVELQGDAFFSVTHNEQLPFVVKAGNFDVVVRGTQFAVSQTKKQVYVQSGKVEVDHNDKRVVITDNQAVKIENNNIVPVEINDPNYLAWKTGIVKFENTSLDQVVKTLSDLYGKEVKLSDSSLRNLKITVTFDNQNLGSVVKIIANTLDLKAEKRGNVYILKQ